MELREMINKKDEELQYKQKVKLFYLNNLYS